MDSLVSSRWGRPLGQYIADYGMDGAMTDLLLSGGIFSRGVSNDFADDIRKVSEISSDNVHGPNRVTMSTLKALLRLSYSPFTYPHLASPALIRGCIKLMSTIQLSDKPSPFSYELGYLCFRLITACLGACLLDNTGVQSFKERSSELRPALVTPVVEGLVSHSGGRGREDYNCILGWSSCPMHARTKVQVIISLSDTRLLLDMLYTDRYFLLKALRSTHSPGLSAVVFLLWRYVNYNRSLQGQPAVKLLQPFLEIFYRCWVISSTDQHASFRHMYDWDRTLYPDWEKEAIEIRVEDSRELVCLFIDHLNPASAQFDLSESNLSLINLSNTMTFLTPRILPGAEDLLGHLIGALIERLWRALIYQEESNTLLAEGIGTMLSWVKTIIMRLNCTWGINPGPVMQILDAMIDADLLQLFGRTILILDTTLPESKDSPGFMANFKILNLSRQLFEEISKMAPGRVIEEKLRPCLATWWKVYRHFQFMGLVVSPGKVTPKGNRWGFYNLCSETWWVVLDFISPNSDKKARQLIACSYKRCPDPGILAGAEYACSECWIAKYCTSRCQVMDWLRRNNLRSHRIVCPLFQRHDMEILEEHGLAPEFVGSAYG